ncbi:mitochondrial 54S ribosomal protein uL24m [Dipodascopsis tothii]|uniref:mitochondrial 54S ribosomal protein uL24m n=1 Tax=Dipodascopsis tothii TaxID=44089 RepID=UPI0034CF6239
MGGFSKALNPGQVRAGQASTGLRVAYKRLSPAFINDNSVSKEDRVPLLDVPFAAGDEVQVIEGSDKGRIGVIEKVQDNMNRVSVSGLGEITKLVLPQTVWVPGQTQHVVEYNTPIPYESVRLVTNIPEAGEGGKMRKVAVRKLRLGEVYYDERYGRRMRRRYVHGEKGLEIPWPEPTEERKPSTQSTHKDIVRERTFWVTSLKQPPVPLSALDSLRNKYSRHRRPEITEQTILDRLTPPKMPLTATKKAAIQDRAETLERVRQKHREWDSTGFRDQVELILAEKMLEHERKHQVHE